MSVSTSVDREVLAVFIALSPLARDSRLQPAFARLNSRREFDVEEVLDIGTWSSGERALITWAGALWAGTGQVDIGYIAGSMSDGFLHAALGALAAYAGRELPGFDSSGLPVQTVPEAFLPTAACCVSGVCDRHNAINTARDDDGHLA